MLAQRVLHRVCLGVFLGFSTFLIMMAAEPTVDSLTVKQRAGSKLVDITYTVSDADNDDLGIGIQALDRLTGEQIGIQHLTGELLVSPGTHCLSWDAGQDWDGNMTNDLALTLTASDQPTRYLVIDVSAGPDAQSYPWTEGPISALATDDIHKQSKILLRQVPAGTFLMGSPQEEVGRFSNETQHQVQLTQPFYIGVFEITQRQWELVMGENPSETPSPLHPVDGLSWNSMRGGTWPGGVPSPTSFLGILKSKTGLPLDMPTEARWEYACRAGTATAYYNGTNLSDVDINGPQENLDPIAWYRQNSSGSQEVGNKEPNAWGLYDMTGNLFELCLDFSEYFTAESAVDPVGPENGSRRVIRGGAYTSNAKYCRSAYRLQIEAGAASYSWLGLRIVCSQLNSN
jgi:formylglycine-generating enzyme required for sulfatase activity